MKRISYIFILLLLIPFQTTVIDHLSIHGIKPDLGLIVVYLIGFGMGEMDGIVLGALIGLVMDLFSGGMLGTNLLTKPVVGGLAGLLSRTILNVSVPFSMGILFGLSLSTGFLIYLFLQLFGAKVVFFEAVRWTIFPQALYDAAFGGILLSLLKNPWKAKRVEMES